MRALIVAVAALLVVGCTSPVRPAPVPTNTAPAVARVTIATTLASVDGPALPGVSISLDGRAVAVTDAAGRTSFEVPAGREVVIGVSHPIYRPFIPAVASTFVPGSDEQWAFAFEP